MELQELIGEHILDAVDSQIENIKQEYGDSYEDCEVFRFRLDGNTYAAIEDPEDGYRSNMKELKLSKTKISNFFSPVKVIGKYKLRDEEYGCECDILELIGAKTGKVIVKGGTDNTDAYYPFFVASFDPTALESEIAN